MLFTLIIYWCNFVIWLIPPLRQYKSKYFYFFIVLALSDPLTLFLNKYLHIYPLKTFLVMSFLLLLSLFETKVMREKSPIVLVLFLLTLFISWKADVEMSNVGIIVFHVFIMGIVIRDLMIGIGKNYHINIFLIAVLLYETTIIIKLFSYLAKSMNYIVFYYSTTGFEILLAIFFIFFRENNKKVQIKLSQKNHQDMEFKR